jgi:glycosyltransferase involved in cell wall biosynthesis
MKSILYVVIAVCNEADNVPRLVSDLTRLRDGVRHEFDTRLVIVDDGSRDGTADLLKRESQNLNLEILHHDGNQGPGAAFGTAFEYLAQNLNPDDWVATMEGDNTSRIETLLQMSTRRREGYDVVFASPYSYGGGFAGAPWRRRVLSHLANQLTMIVLRISGFHVLSSFFRLHSAPTLLKLQKTFGPRIVETRGFEWALEMLYKMVLLSVRISEVETLVDWQKRAGVSKMKTAKTSIGYIKIFLAHSRWKSLVSDNRSIPAWNRHAE